MSNTLVDNTRASTLPEETLRFLHALHHAAQGLIEIRLVFHDKENPQAHSLFFASIPDIEAAAGQIMAENAASFHIFAGVSLRRTRSGKKEDVASVGALWADLDAKDFSDDVEEGKRLALARLANLPPELQPSVIVDSGNGYHVYWLLKSPVVILTEEDRQAPERIMAGLANTLNGDSVHDLGRLLRLPGTFNVKEPAKPRPCVIVKADYDRKFEIEQFEPFAAKSSSIADTDKIVFNATLPTITLDALRVSPKIKTLIEVGDIVGHYPSRSEADAAVAAALVNGKHSDDEIRSVFANAQWSAGDRYREPAHGDRYLQRTLAKARAFVADNPLASTPAPTKTSTRLSIPLSAVFSADFKDPDYIVRELIREASTGFFGGEAKHMKSLTALYMALCIAAGIPVFGHFLVPRARRVLFIEEEDDLGLLKLRLALFKTLLESQWPTDENFRLVVRSGLKIDPAKDEEHDLNPQAQAVLMEIAAFRPDIVFLDVFNRIHTGDENSQRDMTRVMGYVEKIRRDYGCAVILLHHFAKQAQGKSNRSNQRLRGSSVLGSWSENSLFVVKKDRDNMLTIDAESKYGAPQPFAVQLEQVVLDDGRQGLRFVYKGDPVGRKQVDNREKVFTALTEINASLPDDCTVKSLARATGMKDTTVRNCLHELEDEDRVGHRDGVSGSGQSPHIYFPKAKPSKEASQ
jgi:hypothetical protein